MTSVAARCHWCERTPQQLNHAINRCGGCTTLGYCGRDCQRSDWRHHKECQAIKAEGPMPNFKRAALLHQGDSALPPDPDTVYYTRTDSPHILDVSLAGPFYPMDRIVEHIKGRCIRAGSLPAIPLLDEIIENVGIVGLEHPVAPLPFLPEGQHMTIGIVREKNSEVAAFLRSRTPNSPRPVYSLFKQICHPESTKLLANRSRWPFEHVPTLDFEILETFLWKEAANEGGRKALAVMGANKKLGDTVSDMLHDGCFVGQLCEKGVPKQILMVHFDDGKIERDGVISY